MGTEVENKEQTEVPPVAEEGQEKRSISYWDGMKVVLMIAGPVLLIAIILKAVGC